MIALVAAAGRGTRLGGPVPKAFAAVGGRTLLERSVDAMAASGVVDEIVVVISPEMDQQARAALGGRQVRLVHGGAERADSVWEGVKAIAGAGAGADDVVLVHDAARALTPPAMVARVARAVLDGSGAVVPVVPVADTIKTVDGSEVTGTLDRSRLAAAQTPQGFDLGLLRRANEAYFAPGAAGGFTATDDASLVEWAGDPVATVAGDPLAFKITTPIDMRLAEAIAGGKADD